MKSLGNVIKETIQSIPKMSLRKLELLSGVTRSEISLIINKKRKRPTPQVLRKLSASLKLDYIYLYALVGYLDEKDYRRMASAKQEERSRPETAHEEAPLYQKVSRRKEEIFRMIQSLPDSQMPKIKDYIELIQIKVQQEKKKER